MNNSDFGIEPLGLSNSQMEMVNSLKRKINEIETIHENDKNELLLKIKRLENQYSQVLSLIQHTGRERVENNYQSNANLNNFPISSFYGSPGSTSSHEYFGMPINNKFTPNTSNITPKTKNTTRKKKTKRKPNGRR